MPRRPKDRSEYEGYDPVVTSPEPIERSEEEGYDPVVTMPRQDYKGFQMPSGMSLPQRRKWKRSIDVRESGAGKRQEARDDADTEALKQGIIDRTKDVGGAIKGAVEDVVLAGPRAKAAVYSDPEGAKEFGRAVVSGDRPAIRTLSEEVSKSAVEPFATAADATLGGLAAERGDFGEAALYGGLLLLPATLQTLGGKLSKGWLKSAAEAGEELPDEAAKKMNDLAKRVDEGKVTDDMQIRREIAMIEDAHALDYAKSRPVEDPMQQGRSRPRADVDPEGAREFDREPPGYMGMSRPNQPMSRFSEGHERFIDELRTDMAEDTNFGELSGRFYNDLLAIDKREDMLRSVGKDARGRQLDDVQITQEYEKLSKERQTLANEYYVGKAEREAALRHEGSYVPPGSKTSLAGEPVTPPGGVGAGNLTPQKGESLADWSQRTGKTSVVSPDEDFTVFGKDTSDLTDNISRLADEKPGLADEFMDGLKNIDVRERDVRLDLSDVRKGLPPRSGRNVSEDQLRSEYRSLAEERKKLAVDLEYYTTKPYEPSFTYSVGGDDPEDYLPSGGGKPPGGGGVSDKLTSEDRKYLQDKIRQSDEKLQNLEGYPRRRDGSIDHSRLEGVDLVTQQYRDMYQQMLDNDTKLYAGQVVDPDLPSMRGGGDLPGGGARKRAALRSAKLSKYSEDEIANAVDRLRSGDIEADISNHKFFAEAEGRSVDQEFIDMKQRDLARLRSRDLSDDEIAEHIEGRRAANRRYAEAEGGGSEGPSEAEIQAMVDQRFGDPNELEMMKEDMRRMAELTQDEQIAQAKKGRTRRSRTPGAPGATEGSVKRERPMPKAKKGKYEN